MSPPWKQQAERSNVFWIRLLLNLGLLFGRPLTRALLPFIVLYFWLFSRRSRDHSQAYLQRVLPRPATACDGFRHLHCFASTVLDRLFLFAGKDHWFAVDNPDAHLFDQVARDGSGAILMLAHVGSFDALRLAVQTRKDNLRLRVLMDLSQAPAMNSVLRSLNPELMDSIIDSSQYDGAALMLRIREELASGAVIAIMADRLFDPAQRTLSGDFLGGRAQLPATPWMIACVMQVPVFLGLGLYLGGRRYRLRFMPLMPARRIERRQRQQLIQAQAQHYLDQLQQVLLEQPYNWFNFYDFWAQSPDRSRSDATTS